MRCEAERGAEIRHPQWLEQDEPKARGRTWNFVSRVEWTGNRGQGTATYRGHDRTWDIATPGKPVIHCSNDPRLGGDPSLPNPEDLLIASVAACHMLWYLHLASKAGIVVTHYRDDPIGVGESTPDGTGRFVRAVLKPHVIVLPGADLGRAEAIHHEIAQFCFIARSVNFPITHEPTFEVADAPLV
jgi:organic hydroperoxide reductase OsmC/OhrA